MKFFLKNIFAVIFLLLSFSAFSQKVNKIHIVAADEARFDNKSGITARRLIGNVIFKHDDAYMYCDSAWFYPNINTMDAYGNVRIEQGDSVEMSGKRMSYDGNSKIAKIRDSVVLTHNNSYLRTDSLDFNRAENVGYYFNYGEIDHENIHLTSYEGYYYPNLKDYYAVDSVRLVHPDYTIFADTLKYNIDSRITSFLGETNIVNDSASIHCTYGWYDTENDISYFGKGTTLFMGAQILKADSLYYDRNTQYGEAYWNVCIQDTVEQFIATGNYAFYDADIEESLITDSALVMYYDNLDTTYIHADTMFLFKTDDDFRKILAYNHVQIFKSDFQGRCDSMIYFEQDSIAYMYGNPILWAEGSQIVADTIEMLIKDNVADQINLVSNAFIAMEEDSSCYSQISGKNMIAKIRDNELYKIDVTSNAETIYFLHDDKTNDIIGVNKEVSDKMSIFRENGQIERIDFLGRPDGALLPEKDIVISEMRLRHFVWYGNLRPMKLEDVFFWK
jgi:lipopolysaccharide assembly outer membrane protein LptD (OstA)